MRLSKHISILLCTLILASNMGFALNVHYCHGEVAAVSLAYKVSEPCNDHHESEQKTCCGKEDTTHKSCCKNDLVKLQDTKSDNIIIKSLQLDLGAFCPVAEWKPVPSFTEAPLLAADAPSFYCEANAPPLFKLYCQYIFYA